MKATIFAISLAFSLGLPTVWAGQLDPRFEGVWVGTEVYNTYVSATQHPNDPIRMTALIAIADGGKTFGVLQGLGPGRYQVSPNSEGNKLSFKSHLSGNGRTSCTFVLSPDGNTLTETGFGLLPGKPYAVNCSISGTLHRQAKK